MSEDRRCDALAHLEWTLTFDWSHRFDGRPLTPGWQSRAVSWRDGRVGTPPWSSALSKPGDLSWRGLCEAQSLAGLDPSFRSGPAFCGSRAYGYYEGLENRFARKLDADGRCDTSPLARAIRGYLDIIHIHPFNDGNTRAACTWFTWSMVSGGLDIPDLGLLIDLPKPPANNKVPHLMERLVRRTDANTHIEEVSCAFN